MSRQPGRTRARCRALAELTERSSRTDECSVAHYCYAPDRNRSDCIAQLGIRITKPIGD